MLVLNIDAVDILRIMRTPENIFEGAYAYLLVTFIGVPCTFFYNLLSSIIRALGDSKTPFWFLLFAAVLNIILAITKILTSTDDAERQELYKSVLTNLHEDAMYLPLTYECNKALYTSALHGVHFGTDQYDVPFADMYFE